MDLLRVRLHDRSEGVSCLKGIEADGLLMGLPKGAEQKLLYGDIAAVTGTTSASAFLNRVVLPSALAGVIYGTVKIGSNTPQTGGTGGLSWQWRGCDSRAGEQSTAANLPVGFL